MKALSLAALAIWAIADEANLPSCSVAEFNARRTGPCTQIVPIADLPIPPRHAPAYRTQPWTDFRAQPSGHGARANPPYVERQFQGATPKGNSKQLKQPPVVSAEPEELPTRPAAEVAKAPSPSLGETTLSQPTVSYVQEELPSSGPPTIVIVILVIILLVAFVALMGGAFLGETFERRKHERKARERNERIINLRKEREIVRLSNQVDDAREWAKLRDLRIQAAKARLQGKADEHRIDGVVTRRALDDLMNGGPQIDDAPPLVVAERHLVEEIENRKADGKDTGDLDVVLQRLRQGRG